MAPPGLSAADLSAIRAMVAALDGSAPWATARARFGWTDAYLDGEAFARFVVDESARVAGVLRRLGL